MSKGSKSITLTPHHDVPMIFTSQSDKEQEPKSEESTRDNSWQERSCPPDCGGRPSAEAENEVLSSPSSSQESSTTASTSSSSSSSEASPKPKKKVKKKACERKKQRFVKSKYAKAPSARHNLYTHFPADPDCEICKMTNNKSSLQSRSHSGTRWSTSSSKVWRQVNRRPQNAHW